MNQKGFIQIVVIALLLTAVAGSLILLKKVASTIRPTVQLVAISTPSPSSLSSFSPQPSSPQAAIITASPTPKPNVQEIITTEDNGRTVTYKKKAVFDIRLKDVDNSQYESFTSFDPEGIVNSNDASSSARYYDRSFVGANPGETAVTILSRPICKPGQACPQYIKAFKVFVQIIP